MGRTITGYALRDTKTGAVLKTYGASASQRNAARRRQDRLDNEYGAVRYTVDPIYTADTWTDTPADTLDQMEAARNSAALALAIPRAVIASMPEEDEFLTVTHQHARALADNAREYERR